MKLQYLASLLCTLPLLTACISDSQPEIKTGTLLNTAGVDYDTPSQHGRTTANGEFQYVAGETVTFHIGSLLLGQVAGKAMITPQTLANSSDVKYAHKIMQLLLTLDEDDNANNGIQIAASDAARFVNEQSIKSASLSELLDHNGIAHTLVSEQYTRQFYNLSMQAISGNKPVPRYSRKDAESGLEISDEGIRAGCVSDSQTGLSWEVKTTAGLRAAKHRYLPAMVRGVVNTGQCDPALEVCAANDYSEKVNETRLCGFDDWRTPTETELKTLLDPSQYDASKKLAATDRHAFPDAEPTFYWSDTLRKVHGFLAVWFDDTHKTLDSTLLAKERYGALRLVRGPIMPDAPSKEDQEDPNYIPLTQEGRLPKIGEPYACVDINDRALLVNKQKTEIRLLAPSDASAMANQSLDPQQLKALITASNTGSCAVKNWRLPTPTEMSKILTLALDSDNTELRQALPYLDVNASYWTGTADKISSISASSAIPQNPATARVLLISQTARPFFERMPNSPNTRPSDSEFAAWRSQYVRYQPGSATQPNWPAPTLDASTKEGFADLGLLPAPTFPASNPYSPEKVALGEKLFADPRLSRNNQISCASCHDPKNGWSDSKELSEGHVGQLGGRNAMTIINTAYVKELFWDGRAKSLEEQAKGPISNPLEMHQSLSQTAYKIAAAPEYAALFSAAFGDNSIDADRIAKAIATYERTITSKESAFDQFLKGDSKAISNDALWGLHLFRTKARCINCHNTPLMSDNQYHSNGLHYYGRELEDLGRYGVTKNPADIGKFRTPMLRDIIYSGNYMHNGLFSMGNGVGVLAMYNAGMVQTLPTGLDKFDPNFPKTSPEIKSLGLSKNEINALFEFMKAISAKPRTGPATAKELFQR
ncbi:cytochrome c peroxidase [Iodobacter sp. CM08]|uniref:cytochrome c peroxidase n=1 Tax=Iodobacter sp. CM08 TaxID=3085902 RepID=UPI002980E6C5|nr:cytochrome c peroxidase [Iodobacter sp. CM08]MDW5416389.1 cytochrome c peroxidase [Iodobacter sp. CM08]